MTILQYIGHSAFFINTGEYGILTDPFISGNPKSVFDLKNSKVTNIFLTHGHSDHLGDAIPLSKAFNAPVCAIFELANYCAAKGAATQGINMGGKISYPWGSAKFLPAFHSSATPEGHYAGMPAAILFEINGVKIYHAGDTCLNSEMKVLKEVFRPDVAILPIGGTFTMDVEQAAIAAQWIGASKVIPMHYNTFDAIAADVSKFVESIKEQGKEPIVMPVGECIEI